MAQQLGKGHLYGLGTASIVLYGTDGTTAVAGYISPNLKSLKVSHASGKNISIEDQNGNVTGKIYTDEMLECTFDFIPEGSSIANAALSARLPVPGTKVVIANLQVIPMGGFADALNAAASGVPPWIYEGGGTCSPESEKEWTATIPLKRYLNITTGAPIT